MIKPSPRESVWAFWPQFAWKTLYNHAVIAALIGRLLLLVLAIARDPKAQSCRDQALTPVGDDDDATLDLLTKTTGGQAAVAQIRKVAGLTGVSRVA